MYRIRASNGREGAVIEKEDGTLHFSLGPDRIMYDLQEEDAQPVDEEELEALIEDGFIRHDPPTKVPHFEGWPVAAVAYEAKQTVSSASAAD